MKKDPFKILITNPKRGLKLIMKHHGPKLKKRIERFIGRSGYLIKDVIQEVHIEMVSRSEEIAGKENAVSWMMNIAKNMTSNLRRKDHQPEKLPIESAKRFAAQESADDDLYYKELVEQVEEHIPKLSPKEQLIVRDSVLNGLSNTEIEEKYNLKCADVKNTKSTGVRKLRHYMNGANEDNGI